MTQGQGDLTGQWALVTGGGKRIGAEICRGLHRAGANVAIHYRSSAQSADELAQALNGTRADSAITLGADLVELSQIDQLVAQVAEHCGRLDVLVNNASSFYPTPLGTVTPEQWEDLMGSNLKAPLFLSQGALPMLRKNKGVIINLIDIHAQRPLRSHAVYGPAKAGLAMLTRSLAKDLGPDIRVNGVAPGAILWPEDADDMPQSTKRSIIRQIPLGREGAPSDIAKAVVFLVKDAPYVTGQILAVDGGRSVGW